MADTRGMKINVEVDPHWSSVATVRPGDTLLVGMNISLTDEEYGLLVQRWQPVIDQGVKVFLIEQCSALAVLRPGTPEQPDPTPDPGPLERPKPVKP